MDSGQPCRGLAAVLAIMLMMVGAGARAGESQLVVTERLGRAWEDELVTFTRHFAAGECHEDSLQLFGAEGPVPVQVLSRETWDGEVGFLKHATIGCFVSVAPFAKVRRTLTFGDRAVESLPAAAALQVTVSPRTALVKNPRIAVEFRNESRTFDPPAAPADVPGPVGRIFTADGLRLGGSAMYGPTPIASCHAELVAAGPVLAEMRWRYVYANGAQLLLRARLGARDTLVAWDLSAGGNLPDDGCRLFLTDGSTPLSQDVQMEFYSKRPAFQDGAAKPGAWTAVDLAAARAGVLTNLTPWADWWDDTTQTVILLRAGPAATRLAIASRDPGSWVIPDVRGDAKLGVWQGTAGRFEKRMPLRKLDDGTVALEANLRSEPGGRVRRWVVGVLPDAATRLVDRSQSDKSPQLIDGALQEACDKRRLDEVSGYVLEWPRDSGRVHPRLFASRDDIARWRTRRNVPPSFAAVLERARTAIPSRGLGDADTAAISAYLATGTAKMAADTRILDRARRALGLLGDFDVMRHAQIVAALYDALVDSGMIDRRERAVWDAQLAYLCYRMADPATWSLERRYASGNPNMSAMHIMGLGTVACAISDHPAADEWIDPAIRYLDFWLDHDVGPQGEWMEGAHYDHVTAASMLSFAVAARHAGRADFFAHPKFKLFMEYLAKNYTPPDPAREGFRVLPPLGRGPASSRLGLVGIVARMAAASDPDYASRMQWMWKQCGEPYQVWGALAGCEYFLLDPALPAAAPRWGSEFFPQSTAVLRRGFGTPAEHYLNVAYGAETKFLRPGEVGSLIDWFAFGRPVAGLFSGGYDDRHELLTNRVVLARSPSPDQWRAVGGFTGATELLATSTQESVDYADARYGIEKPHTQNRPMPPGVPPFPPVATPGRPPVSWRRQLMFVKGRTAADGCYLVLRDTVSGGQPTAWQFWTLSNGIVPTAELPRTRRPERQWEPLPARPLAGDRLTALGQFGVDLDFFFAAPAGPRNTLRWGRLYDIPVKGLRQYQDLVQARLDGDGAYFVVVYPRPANARPPTFESLAEGRAIAITGDHGRDVVVLGDDAAPIEAGGLRIAAVAACIQRQGDRTILSLPVGGAIRAGDETLESEAAATKVVASPPP